MKRDSLPRRAAVSLALAAVFALVFYICNTPLGSCIGSDNAMYLTMGTALARGYAPYTQIFDHKGPLLFLLQALPQMLSGGYSMTAVFIQQVVFLALSLLALAAIARALRAPQLPAMLGYLALIGPFVSGGNLTEEYASLFTLVGLLTALRVFGGKNMPDARRMAFPAALMGAMAALAFMTRANNALPLCALALGLALALLAGRRFAALGRCALGFAGGALAACLPVAIWLAAQGALGEAIYGSIIHNMMYAKTGGGSRLHMLLHTGYGRAALLMLALSLGGAAVSWRRGNRALGVGLAACAVGGFAAGFISHKFYDHYLIVGAPCAAVGMTMLLGAPRGVKIRRALGWGLAAVCAVCLCVSGRQANETRIAEREGLDTFIADAKALYALVPEAEQDSFMAYRVEPKWYVAAEALPCMRFYFLQEILGEADPAVMDEIAQTFESDPPRWLVLFYNREFSPPYDARVAAIFETEYEFVAARGQYQLLRHVDDATGA